MERKPNKQYRLIYIEWADAITDTGWKTEKQSIKWAESNDWVVKNVGWLLKETKGYILLAAKYSEITQEYGLLHKIPTTWIRKRKILKI